jgi:hypothetical protein
MIEMVSGSIFIKLENFSQGYQNIFNKMYPTNALSYIDHRGVAYKSDRVISEVINTQLDVVKRTELGLERNDRPYLFGTYDVRSYKVVNGVKEAVSRIGYSTTPKSRGRLAGVFFIIDSINFGAEFYLNKMLGDDKIKLSRQTQSRQVMYGWWGAE